MRWLGVLVLASCVSSNSVVCDFGLCPEGTACDPQHALCVAPDQLSVCTSLAAGAECAAAGIAGHCVDGVCLPTICADGVIEPGELCDDGNTLNGDDCSADCMSDLTCGNGRVDAAKGEQCDDANLLDHDGCSSTCRVETPRWFQLAVSPQQRTQTALAYDARRDRIVMFAGFDTAGSVILGDTWEWNGGEWERHTPTGAPLPRMGHAMAADPLGNVMMFGGNAGISESGDTWIWDGASWTNLDVAGPSPREGPSLAYDAKHHVTIAFGGFGPAPPLGNQDDFDDTYAWDGTAWTKLSPAHRPPPRENAMFAFDPARGVLVLTGGKARQTPTKIYTDTWTFDGTDWTDVTNGPSPGVEQAAIAWDVTSQRLIVYGGTNASAPTSATWAWNGTQWSSVSSPSTPPARSAVVAASNGSRFVIFGGALVGGAPTADTWTFANGAWAQPKDFGTRTGFALVGDPVRGNALFYGGALSVAGVGQSDTWELTRSGYVQRTSGNPAGRVTPCIAYDPIRHETVMFGGSMSGTANAETWIWNGTTWSLKTQALPPEARYDATCAFDGTHVTMFGGRSGAPLVGTAWSWTGTQWVSVVVPPQLRARYGAVAAYDPIAKHMVLFGGHYTGAVLLSDTWTYDGTTWAEVSGGFVPPVKVSASLAWNAARGSLILVGGNGVAEAIVDAFEWHVDHWQVIPAVTSENGPSARQLHASITTLDGTGVMIYGGQSLSAVGGAFGDRFVLRWDAARASERCNQLDVDRDGAVGCADPDCWAVCTPSCSPGTSCDATAPHCGDGVCDANLETCATCPADCTCVVTCGDGTCSPSETCPGDCP